VPPFRVAGKHADRKHPNSALFQVGQPHDTREQADAALKDAEGLFDEEGYKYRVQELVDADGGERRWKDLKS
jgi:hypothetical protein